MKVLDEPAASQSDATVLELQLRAISKKQHGDVAVRQGSKAEEFKHEAIRLRGNKVTFRAVLCTSGKQPQHGSDPERNRAVHSVVGATSPPRSIENANKNPAEIDKWIQSIDDLHRTKPPPQVNYKNNMPDIEVLMEAWPPEVEEIIDNVNGLSPEIDLPLEDYARMICAIMDIPVYDNIVESLHVLFTTYMEFKSNAHFMQLGAAGAGRGRESSVDFGYK